MAQRLTVGRIVWAEVQDANGVKKMRPAVIVRVPNPLTEESQLDIVAVTSRLAKPLPEDHVLLPWHPQGHPRTGLNRQSAAVCSWVGRISAGAVKHEAGLVPTPLLHTILQNVAATLTPPPPSQLETDPESGGTS